MSIESVQNHPTKTHSHCFLDHEILLDPKILIKDSAVANISWLAEVPQSKWSRIAERTDIDISVARWIIRVNVPATPELDGLIRYKRGPHCSNAWNALPTGYLKW